MSQFQPIWEKSFVIVNKEQGSGILCYCFSVGETQVDTKPVDQIEKSGICSAKTELSEDAEKHVEPALKDIASPTLFSEEDCLDHKLLVYKGKYCHEDVMIRVLHKSDNRPVLCENCLVRKTCLDRAEMVDITKSLSHSCILRPLVAKCMSALSFVIVPCLKKSLKEVIDSRQNLREGTEEDVRFLSACLTDAVMYLHERLIVHRNICPLTVYLSAQGYPSLGCFEQATRTKELGAYSLGSCGTLGYQSPEVVAQLGYNHTLDFWGIGCVAYEFLFGIMPFVDADVSRMLSKTVLNPDFAFTRLGGRFTRLPKAAQEALRDGFLNRYPHKRTGFKLYEVRQLRWFQPFRWDMIREKRYKSCLERYVTVTSNNNSVTRPGRSPRSPNWRQHRHLETNSSYCGSTPHIEENREHSTEQTTAVPPTGYQVHLTSSNDHGAVPPSELRHVNDMVDLSGSKDLGAVPPSELRHVNGMVDLSSPNDHGAPPSGNKVKLSSPSNHGGVPPSEPRHVNHTAGMFDFQTLLQQSLLRPLINSTHVSTQPQGQRSNRGQGQTQSTEDTTAMNPLQTFIQKHFQKDSPCKGVLKQS